MVRQNWWTTLCSYLTEIGIERRKSEISGELEVSYRRGRYALSTQQAVYSYQDLYLNFKQSFQRLPLADLPIQKVLVLGMGLGSIPFLLEKTFHCNYQYTLVEIDPVIIDLARKYGCLSGVLQSEMQVVCADAAQWVKSVADHSYDLIAVDIFIDDENPTQVESIDFLQDLKRIAAPNTLLLYNRLTYNEKIMQKTRLFFEKNFKFVFNNAIFFELNGNRMLLNHPIPDQ